MSDKMKRAEMLLGAIGNIDDELVFEAMSYKPRRRSPRLLYVAACVAVIAALVLCTSVVLQVAGRVRTPEINGLPDGILGTVDEDTGSDSIAEPMPPQESQPAEELPADSYTESETLGEVGNDTMAPAEPQDSEPVIYDSDTEMDAGVEDTEAYPDSRPNADGSYGNGHVGSTGGYPDPDGNDADDGEGDHKTFIIIDIVSAAVLVCALVVLITVRRRYKNADANDTDN